MIIRAWLIAGGALIVVAWILTVTYSPQPFQRSATSSIDAYRARGLVPGAGQLAMSRTVGHEVFEIPETDALHAREAAAVMADMPGMSMPGMGTAAPEDHGPDAGHDDKEPAHGEQSMAPMKMDMKTQGAAGHADSPGMAPGMKSMETGKEPGHGEQPMAGMKVQQETGHGNGSQMAPGMQPMEAGKEPAHGEQPMAGMKIQAEAGHGDGSQMAAGMQSMEAGKEPAHGEQMRGHGGGGGLMLVEPGVPMAAGARTIHIEMSEWGFSPAELDVRHGESVRLVVRNTGNMPHEFMLMAHAAMGAVDYRLQRADWNLLEHEAIYERELLLPRDEMEVTVKIMQPGAWMYMCMFPYHMQLGMMGVMATEGMAMDMGGMKM